MKQQTENALRQPEKALRALETEKAEHSTGNRKRAQTARKGPLKKRPSELPALEP